MAGHRSMTLSGVAAVAGGIEPRSETTRDRASGKGSGSRSPLRLVLLGWGAIFAAARAV